MVQFITDFISGPAHPPEVAAQKTWTLQVQFIKEFPFRTSTPSQSDHSKGMETTGPVYNLFLF